MSWARSLKFILAYSSGEGELQNHGTDVLAFGEGFMMLQFMTESRWPSRCV